MKLLLPLLLLAAATATAQSGPGARFTVTSNVLRTAAQTPPLGFNYFGGGGSIEWAANNLVVNPGNEPIHWRNVHRAVAVGDSWFEVDGGGTSAFDQWNSGFLSGADVRIYRLVDKAGKALPARGDYLDISQAAGVRLVAATKVAEAGTPGLPDGGWVANRYSRIRHNTLRGTPATVDAGGLTPGRSYFYVVRALAANGEESPPSNEASAAPVARDDEGPAFAFPPNESGLNVVPGQDLFWSPTVVGGARPLKFEVEGALPPGLRIDAANGTVSGRAGGALVDGRLTLVVTDAKGRSDRHVFVARPAGNSGGKLAAPANLKAVADGTRIRLSWDAVPGAAGYALYRSTAPAARQETRVYLAPGSPKVEKFDYIVVSKKWVDFKLDALNPRIRGLGHPIDELGWPWRADTNNLKLSLERNTAPVPAGADFGESVLAVRARPGVSGTVWLDQLTMISPDIPGQSLWYGQLEPGKRYRAEFWLRGERLGNGGRVGFSFGRGYPDLRTTWTVSGAWQRFRYDFTAPARPTNTWHFGPLLEFTAPGTLYVDNGRVSRIDEGQDAAAPYLPNQTILDEVLASQPASGPKGVHRMWFLNRSATMDSILGWHANSRIVPSWNTFVSETLKMTLPTGLMFAERTGNSPETRMRPYLVLAHVLHSEADWRNLVEYLAAPYDPARDTPAAKPYAHRRFQQRGHGRPWTDTFAEIRIELGNETWHNGMVDDDWIGFGRSGRIRDGGTEYGLFARYLVDEIRASRYWASEKLDQKLKFVIGAGYDGRVERFGGVAGYGEDAIQQAPLVRELAQANYVGPKWETGEAAMTRFNDEGVQATLLAWVEGLEPSVKNWAAARKALAAKGRVYDLVAYESGPSGYSLPTANTPPEAAEVQERYGKSLAMGVSALDTWLGSYAYGYTDQAFHNFGQGLKWNSHTIFSSGFRPSPAWLALSLRNRIARGDFMEVSTDAAPSVVRNKERYPAVAAYAFRDGKRWTVFLLSRTLAAETDVELALPFGAAAKLEEHRLAGDPRQGNLEAMNIRVASRDLDPAAVQAGKLRARLPAGSILAFVLTER